MKITAETLLQNGWYNSWIDGVRRWHHKQLPAHFKSLADAKALYLKHQKPNERPLVLLSERDIARLCGGRN